jgi:hypothetical protein
VPARFCMGGELLWGSLTWHSVSGSCLCFLWPNDEVLGLGSCVITGVAQMIELECRNLLVCFSKDI